jgi:hypothetical protein
MSEVRRTRILRAAWRLELAVLSPSVWRASLWRWRVSMIAGKTPAVQRRHATKTENKGDARRMIRNPKSPVVRQPLLFSLAAPPVVELPTEKRRELQTALAELLLNTLTANDSSDSGETDDAPQAHA